METASGGGTPGLVDALRWLPRGLRSGCAQRASWGIVDQGISSFTNFALIAVVAHEVAPAAFGAFSVALAVYICMLWVSRSLVGEPYVVRLTASTEALQVDAGRDALGAAALTGAAGGVAAAALGLAIGGPTGSALAAMGLFLPALLAQDAYRYLLLARGRNRGAAANDGVWLAVQSVAMGALVASGRVSDVALIAAFGAGATAGAAYGMCQSGAVPALGRARRWLRRVGDLSGPFLVELLIVNATPQLAMLAVASLGDVITVGSLRAGFLLFAPLGVLFSGVFLVGLPEAVRVRSRSLAGLRHVVVALAAATSALTAAWAGGLSALPPHVGRALLKSNWDASRQLIWPVAAFTAASAAVYAAVVGLRALEAARHSLRQRIWAGPVVFASGIVGARLGGAPGAATGLAVSSWLSAAVAWLALHRALSTATGAGPAPPAELRECLPVPGGRP